MTSTFSTRESVHDGILYKVGGKVKSWNKRFFVLKSDYCLYYFKDTTKAPLGTISLRDPMFKVRKGEPGDISWPRGTKMENTMAIVTAHRTYFVFCSYSHEIEEWIRILTKTKEKIVTQSCNDKSLSGNRSSSSSKVEQSKQAHSNQMNGSVSASECAQENYEAVYDLPGEKNDSMTSSHESKVESFYALANQETIPEQPLYEDIDQNHSSDQAAPAPARIPPSYEDVCLDNEASETQKNKEELEVYDDIVTDQSLQPLYESIEAPSDDSTHCLQQSTSGSNLSEEESSPPRKDDLPPLPPRMEAPSLPPRDDHPSNENKDTIPLSVHSTPPLTPPISHRSTHLTPPKTPPTPHTTTSTPSSNDGNGPSPKPSPVPRRKISSPQQQPSSTTKPVAKARTRHYTDSEIEEIPPSEQQCDIREQGMLLFKLQKQRLQEAVHEDTKRTKTLCLLEEIATDPTLSPSKKAVFAETMREVEQEKMLASEERFKWERERKKLEEERQKFEEEKRRLQEEMERTRLQIS